MCTNGVAEVPAAGVGHSALQSCAGQIGGQLGPVFELAGDRGVDGVQDVRRGVLDADTPAQIVDAHAMQKVEKQGVRERRRHLDDASVVENDSVTGGLRQHPRAQLRCRLRPR